MSTIKSSNEHLTLNADGSGNDIKFQSNGSEVASISDGGVVTATSYAGSGANLTGISSVGGATGVDFNDNVKARFGTGNDLEIYHDASNTYINENGTGDLIIKGTSLKLRSSGNEDFVVCTADGSVAVRHNDAVKLETTSGGIDVTGAITVNGAALAGGITQTDQFRLHTSFTGNANPVVNWERDDTSGFGKMGSGMSEDTGIFTFPATGLYKIEFNMLAAFNGDSREVYGYIATTLNNSSYTNRAELNSHIQQTESNVTFCNAYGSCFLAVTSTTNCKVRFSAFGNNTSRSVKGDSAQNRTYVTFTRVGDN